MMRPQPSFVLEEDRRRGNHVCAQSNLGTWEQQAGMIKPRMPVGEISDETSGHQATGKVPATS